MTAKQPSGSTASSQRFRSKWISLAFVILASLATLGATTAYWINQTLLDEDRFMEVVTPVIASEQLAGALGDRVAAQTVRALGVEQRVENSLQALDQYLQGIGRALDVDPNGPVGSRLSESAGLIPNVLADPIVERVENRISDLVVRLIETDEFQTLVDTAIRDAHKVAVVIATGDDSGLPDAVTVDGDIELNLRPLIAGAIVNVAQAGADAVGIDVPQLSSGTDPEQILAEAFAPTGIEVPDDFGKVVLVSEAQLAPYQGAVKAMSQTQWILIVLALLLSAAAVWAHPSRRVGAVWLGIGIIVAQLIEWPLSGLFTNAVNAGLADSTGSTLLAVVLDAATSSLLRLAVAVIVVGALVALTGLFLTGWAAAQDEGEPTSPA